MPIHTFQERKADMGSKAPCVDFPQMLDTGHPMKPWGVYRMHSNEDKEKMVERIRNWSSNAPNHRAELR